MSDQQQQQQQQQQTTDVVKRAFVLEGPYEFGGTAIVATAKGSAEITALMRTNDRSHSLLEICKNAIPSVCTCKARRWDDCKRATNPYELVHTGSTTSPGVAAHDWGLPTSRSFYKMWEILQDYRVELGVDRDLPMRAAFLAEGPGGFIEAFARFRDATHDGLPSTRAAVKTVDTLYGMTLVLPRNRNVPSWKVTLPSVQVNLHAGDLYKVDDIDAFVTAAGGEGSCDLVTADGGFDFSNDFNAQERTSTRLVVSEIYAALRLQSDGGHFLLKIYDIRTTTTMRLLYLLRRCYHTVRILKPLTSRPANSEKYVLCTGFRRRERERLLFGPFDYTAGSVRDLHHACGALGLLRAAVASCVGYFPPSGAVVAAYAMPAPPPTFVADIVYFNVHFVTLQAACIAQTLSVALRIGAVPSMDAINKASQYDHARRWCQKYNVTSLLHAHFPSTAVEIVDP